MHPEQEILKPENFASYQVLVAWGTNQLQLQQELPQLRKKDLISIQRLSEDVRIPTQGSKLTAGHDLYSIEVLSIPANNRALVRTGLGIAVPEGTYGRLASRSGLAIKSITVDAGVIDADYRGELKVLLVNHSEIDYKVQKGDRIAQLIVGKIDQ